MKPMEPPPGGGSFGDFVWSEVAIYLSPDLADKYFFSLSRDYALMREDHWEAFLQSIANEPVMLDPVHTWRNPMEQRPACMRKSNPTE